MDINIFLTTGLGASTRAGKLLSDIIGLDHRLKHWDEQSDYFRWSHRLNREKGSPAEDEYLQLRSWFNSVTAEEIQAELDRQDALARSLATRRGWFNAMLRYSVTNRVARLKEYLLLKAISPVLPALEELLERTG
jgi:hypothetical protein